MHLLSIKARLWRLAGEQFSTLDEWANVGNAEASGAYLERNVTFSGDDCDLVKRLTCKLPQKILGCYVPLTFRQAFEPDGWGRSIRKNDGRIRTFRAYPDTRQ